MKVNMSNKQKTDAEYGQYGMKKPPDDEGVPPVNSPGGEVPGVGPVDSIHSDGSRTGAKEDRPIHKPSSRQGQAVINEVDDKSR
jgi:hypothetical protein